MGYNCKCYELLSGKVGAPDPVYGESYFHDHVLLAGCAFPGNRMYVDEPGEGFHVLNGKKQEILNTGIEIHHSFNDHYTWFHVVTCEELQKIIARVTPDPKEKYTNVWMYNYTKKSCRGKKIK